ncbi:MAG: hypothetical protein Q8876_01065, partial [Bacillota bacterium]|nr:hypothetical protein [Bacillota bacterium]
TVGNDKITLTYAKQQFTFYGISWHIRGDLLTKNYDIVDIDNSVIMSHCVRWGQFGDGYEINILSENREILCLCVAICLNHIQLAEIKAPQAL